MGLRILIVAEHASAQFGGEAALPLHYFRVLRKRGEEAWLLVHERTRPELERAFPHDTDRISYIPDTWLHIALWKLGRPLPNRLSYFTTGFVMRLLTQMIQRRMIRRAVKQERIDVIHQPIPVSPKEPSMIYGMGAPVVIGPMNGGMDYPLPFRQMQSGPVNALLQLGRQFGGFINWLMPGKRQAAALLVANQRTRLALPPGVCSNVIELVENGVDLSLWCDTPAPDDAPPAKRDAAPVEFVFLGRLVDWKAVDLLLEAFEQAQRHTPMTLTIIGDGDQRASLETLSQTLGLHGTQAKQTGKVYFAGWRPQAECAQALKHADALVLSSLLECGGAVVLEAMAMGVPVIATNWGGPADYLDASCGILVEPISREGFIHNLSAALTKLATSADLRQQMGLNGQHKIKTEFDWDIKVDQMMKIYQSAATGNWAS